MLNRHFSLAWYSYQPLDWWPLVRFCGCSKKKASGLRLLQKCSAPRHQEIQNTKDLMGNSLLFSTNDIAQNLSNHRLESTLGWHFYSQKMHRQNESTNNSLDRFKEFSPWVQFLSYWVQGLLFTSFWRFIVGFFFFFGKFLARIYGSDVFYSFWCCHESWPIVGDFALSSSLDNSVSIFDKKGTWSKIVLVESFKWWFWFRIFGYALKASQSSS